MAIYFRQVCLVAKHLDPVVKQLGQIFSLPVCHIDPAVEKFGLRNSLFATGTNFIEIVSPLKDGTAAGRYLERLGGDGGYMIICQAETLTEQKKLRQRAVEAGIRIAYEKDYQSWNIMQLHPADTGGAFLEVDWDEQEDPHGNWQPAGGMEWVEKVSDEIVSNITALELQSQSPEELAERWSFITGISLERNGNSLTLPFANLDLRFTQKTDDKPDRLTAIDLTITNYEKLLEQANSNGIAISGNSIMICGVTFNLLN